MSSPTGGNHALVVYAGRYARHLDPSPINPMNAKPCLSQMGRASATVAFLQPDAHPQRQGGDGPVGVGGSIPSNPNVTVFSPSAVYQAKIDRLVAFVVGTDGHLYDKFWDGTEWGVGRSGNSVAERRSLCKRPGPFIGGIPRASSSDSPKHASRSPPEGGRIGEDEAQHGH
jgi:hypothetical protein